MFVSHLYIYINLSIIIFSGQLSYRKLLPVHPALSNKNVNLLSNKKKRQFSLMLCLIKVHMVLGSLPLWVSNWLIFSEFIQPQSIWYQKNVYSIVYMDMVMCLV